MVENRSCVQREGVYRWFSSLTSAQRAEFLCGLLDLCVPIELRFLGSCLEDLARKDYHSLRDAEIKANNPADLLGLTNITDEVVRSKLLVSLALLGSDNREAAGVLYRILTHIDTVINNYGLALNDGRTEEQFLLLFTMASHHPAFSFHQKQVLRQQLSQIQDILQSQTKEAATIPMGRRDQAVSQELTPSHLDFPPPPLPPPPPPPPPTPHLLPPLPAGQGQDEEALTKKHQEKAGKVVIEKVVLRGVTHTSEDISEYVFEASWSDECVSSVVRTQQEVTELLSQLSQAFPDDGVEKSLPKSMELDPRCLTVLPCHVLQHHSVQQFFTTIRPLSPNCPASLPSPIPPLPSSLPTAPVALTCPFISSSNLGCMVQYRGANRAVYRVASVQPVVSTHSSVFTRPSPHLSSLPPPLPPSIPSPQLSSLPPPVPALPSQCSLAGVGDPSSQLHLQHSQSHSYSPQHSQHHLHPQTSSQSSAQPQSLHLPHSHSHSQSLSYPQSHSLSRSPSHTQAPSQSLPSTAEQNSILDWLRRLRLHKYYPVFKQLTMEEFLALTEDDLNQYDLTQGAKKKLKTQLEIQKTQLEIHKEMKMEKRPCSGIARVTPSSHMGPSTHPTSTAGELRVEVDAVLHHHPISTDSSSSSGYSSSSCSPRTPLCCDSTFDRTRDINRHVSGPDAAGGGPEKDRSCLFTLNSSCPTGSSRPTAQVLPVQTDPAPPHPPSCSAHLHLGLPQSPYHPQACYPQTLLSSVSNPARILSSPHKPRPPPLCTEDRTKPLGSGLPAGFSAGLSVGMGVRLESLFPGLNMDVSSTLQDSLLCRGLAGDALGLIETSSALTSTSNSLHHVSHPPLHFHLSSSTPPSPSGYYSYPPTSFSSSCPSTKSVSSSSGGGFVPMATTSSVPVAAVPGNTYYLAQPNSSPSPSPSSTSSLDQSSGHTPSMCVCSSCGCRGNCGAYGALPGYTAASYLQPFSAGPSLFTLGPLLHLSPLVASPSAAGNGATAFSYPLMVQPALYRHSPVSHDQQQGFGFYQPHGIVGNGSHKRAAGNVSCYNCGCQRTQSRGMQTAGHGCSTARVISTEVHSSL
ncbi:zinc finger CCHC domain-containing protein 14 isoform X2 [Cottoperca gobio]|uniref:Zinc finger CCHC domain-containing protein 14 isoform X2 n=1 Tax=Cottoperca gobio TaxID=56716 RepID=A0A6J2PTT7_COTGO|nr:zinc finger CCHC domain-containing protein 14 isoform X2 [Cottoperca gobio]